MELPLDELEQRYDKEWATGKGGCVQWPQLHLSVPFQPKARLARHTHRPTTISFHPCAKDPDNPRKRIYAVFDKIENVNSEEKILGTETRGSSDVPENKAARASMAAALNEKVSGAFHSSDALGNMFKHLRTGGQGADGKAVPKGKDRKPKPKPKPKLLTPEQQQQRDFDKSLDKPLGVKHKLIKHFIFKV